MMYIYNIYIEVVDRDRNLWMDRLFRNLSNFVLNGLVDTVIRRPVHEIAMGGRSVCKMSWDNKAVCECAIILGVHCLKVVIFLHLKIRPENLIFIFIHMFIDIFFCIIKTRILKKSKNYKEINFWKDFFRIT